MKLTPRQIAAFLEFSNIEKAHLLMINAIAAQGDGKLIEKTCKDLNGRTIHGDNKRRSLAQNDA
jgi:hypothetical protein